MNPDNRFTIPTQPPGPSDPRNAQAGRTESGKVRLTVDLSSELNDTLSKLAKETQASKSDILRRAITLMEVAVKARDKGQKVALIDKDQPAKTEIVGI